MALRRLLYVCVLTAVLATGLAASPAHAGRDSCSGVGHMSTPPMWYPVVGPSANGAFALSIPGGCFFAITDLSMAGNISGWCGHALGAGVANGHHSFNFTIEGSVMTFTGGVVGSFYVQPAPGQSCLSGATQWTVMGSVALV